MAKKLTFVMKQTKVTGKHVRFDASPEWKSDAVNGQVYLPKDEAGLLEKAKSIRVTVEV